ncbi:hypothetical protein ACFOEK_20690 [Litoribrevibacter euphylliae]|uniref:Uncharacterized protein n=1 Tax=Litoribrevibacter euphylliae TaxID=1834034 RepID=A0ABV7HLE2_9GAMM
MGDIVSGYILSHSFGGKEREIHVSNTLAIEGLPEYGAYLLRSMFTLPPLDHRLHINTFQVIHFAASYDEMYGLDKEWFKEFQKFLGTLSWWQATVFHSYTGMRIELKAKDHEVGVEAIPTKTWESKYYDSYHNLKEITESKLLC